MSRKAIILLSGGLDSATTLAIAKENNYECYALSVNYHQRHNYELIAAKKIAKYFSVKDLKEVEIDLSWLNSSALTNNSLVSLKIYPPVYLLLMCLQGILL